MRPSTTDPAYLRRVEAIPPRRAVRRFRTVAHVLAWMIALLPLPAVAARIQPRIVNGTPTIAFPSVAALLFFLDPQHTDFDGMCSATLVGCQTLVTAAHCLCDFDSAAMCESNGLLDPTLLQVYLPHAGFFDVASVAIDPDYSFAEAGDVGVIKLGQPVTGIPPSVLNATARPSPGTRATIVGYGRSGGPRFLADDAGINRVGAITTAACINGIPDTTHVCWQFLGTDSNTCAGDSGGPLFVDFGAGARLAGVTSGGETSTCLAPDNDYDTDIFVHREWIAAQAGSDLDPQRCGDLPQVGTPDAQVFDLAGELTAAAPLLQKSFTVPAGTRLLRVTLNGQSVSGQGQGRVDNDFDLFVRAGSAPTPTQFDCKSIAPTTFEACELRDPAAGKWFATAVGIQGVGAVQMQAITFATAANPACIGDCHDDGEVTVDELLIGVSIALETMPLSACTSFDADGNGAVSVDELISAVNVALTACPAT